MKVGVIGAGVMGRGVAQNFAQSEFDVVLLDKSIDVLESAKKEIFNNIRLQRLFKKIDNAKTPEAVLSKIVMGSDYSLLAQVDYVVENIIENEAAKEEVYHNIDTICKPECIFIANTSCISITKISSFTNRKDKVIGVHFMNPVPLKNTVEMIRGYHTSDETIVTTQKLMEEIGKESILINDFPGFVSNRLSHLFMNEAAYVVQDQVATPEAVDDIFKKCYGHTMGPLETADLIGLDTVVDSLQILYDSYQDSKFRCCPLLKKMVAAGLLGKKSGKGFYTYE